jgi:hypothetical protein
MAFVLRMDGPPVASDKLPCFMSEYFFACPSSLRAVRHLFRLLGVAVLAAVADPVVAGTENRLLALTGLPSGTAPQFSPDQMAYG